MVVGGCYVGGNNENLIKKLNQSQFDCDVINDVTLLSHLKAPSLKLWNSEFFEDLTTRWRSTAK